MDQASNHRPEGAPAKSDPGGASAPFPPVEGTLDRALAVVAFLREHCAWDRKQTARTLVPHLLEEAHEVVDAIHAEDPVALRGELGDLLLNLAFQVVVAEEGAHFTRTDVLEELEAKMIRRHPHIFGSGKRESWETIKARERGEEGVLDGMASGLDALLRAYRIQEKVSRVGFDWNEASGALAKVKEELLEVEAALESGERPALDEELGDLLFSAVNLVRLCGSHAVPVLEAANDKFRRRFQVLEALAMERDIQIGEVSLEVLDALWDEVKRREGTGSPTSDQ